MLEFRYKFFQDLETGFVHRLLPAGDFSQTFGNLCKATNRFNTRIVQCRKFFICRALATGNNSACMPHTFALGSRYSRSEEHTSELQSRENLVCRLLL